MSKKPSSEYDPLSYGEIRLQPVQGQDSSGDNPDEILFDDSPPAEASTTFGDASTAFTDGKSGSWDLMEGDIKEYMPSGGSGEEPEQVFSGSPLMTGPDTPAKSPPPATPPGRVAGGIQEEMQVQAAGTPAAGKKRTKPASSKGQAAAARPSGTQRARARPARASMPHRRLPPGLGSRRRNAAMPVALLILAAGLGGGAWFHLQLQNPVLGGVSAAMGLVGSLFAVVLLRR